MIAQVLAKVAAANAQVPLMTCAGLVLFFAVFVGVLVWTGRRERSEAYATLGRLPLDERNES